MIFVALNGRGPAGEAPGILQQYLDRALSIMLHPRASQPLNLSHTTSASLPGRESLQEETKHGHPPKFFRQVNLFVCGKIVEKTEKLVSLGALG